MYNRFLEYMLNNDPKRVVSPMGIRMRKFVHPLIRTFAPLTGHYQLIIVRKEQMPKNTPKIYAATHSLRTICYIQL